MTEITRIPASGPPAPALATEALDIMLTGWRFMQTKILLAAIEVDLFTPLAYEEASEADIQSRLKLHPRAVGDFLDALAAMGLLIRENGKYRAAPAAARYLASDQPAYL